MGTLSRTAGSKTDTAHLPMMMMLVYLIRRELDLLMQLQMGIATVLAASVGVWRHMRTD